MNYEQLKTERIVVRKNQEEVVFFDAVKEIRYLKEIESGRKMTALKQELETAMQELFWVQGVAKDRVLENGRIKDMETGGFLDQIVWNGGNSIEINAFNKIQEGLNGGKKLVVHFSPANAELGYNDNLVDFWINNKEKNSIKYIRCFTNDNFDRFRKIYQYFGGEEIHSRNEMLGNPLMIGDEFKMAQIQKNLMMADEKIEVTNNRIIEVTGKILNNFYFQFGNRIFRDEELINRIYSGIQEVILEGKSLDEVEIQEYIYKRVDRYMFAEIVEMKVREGGGSCPGLNITAEFGSGMGKIIAKVNGQLVLKDGETKGLKFCKICGYYYAGEKCPLCN